MPGSTTWLEVAEQAHGLPRQTIRDSGFKNLGKMKEITKIGLQGRQDYSQWVTKYKVSYSKDGQNFTLQNQVGDDLHKLMHSSIPAVPIPPGNRGAFAHVVSPGD